jgi:hypothetical protein
MHVQQARHPSAAAGRATAGGTFNRFAVLRPRVTTVHATRPLVEVLCELARDADPGSISVRLAATPAGDLVPTDGPLTGVEPETAVLSDFYFPEAGDALTSVFGVDLATPTGQTAGRLVSHPDGNPDVTMTDDLHAQLLVAVPPWNPENVRAYDRNGTRRDLVLLDAAAPDADAPGEIAD